MGTIRICKGDLFAYQGHVAHGVNCHGKMGKGIAILFKKKWPKMFNEYAQACENFLINPGDCWIWMEDGQCVYNLAIKNHWSLPASYAFLEKSLLALLEHTTCSNVYEVAMPWVGCGLGGLHKVKVKSMLEKVVKDQPLDIIVYE